jgi:hypothetical protein
MASSALTSTRPFKVVPVRTVVVHGPCSRWRVLQAACPPHQVLLPWCCLQLTFEHFKYFVHDKSCTVWLEPCGAGDPHHHHPAPMLPIRHPTCPSGIPPAHQASHLPIRHPTCPIGHHPCPQCALLVRHVSCAVVMGCRDFGLAGAAAGGVPCLLRPEQRCAAGHRTLHPPHERGAVALRGRGDSSGAGAAGGMDALDGGRVRGGAAVTAGGTCTHARAAAKQRQSGNHALAMRRADPAAPCGAMVPCAVPTRPSTGFSARRPFWTHFQCGMPSLWARQRGRSSDWMCRTLPPWDVGCHPWRQASRTGTVCCPGCAPPARRGRCCCCAHPFAPGWPRPCAPVQGQARAGRAANAVELCLRRQHEPPEAVGCSGIDPSGQQGGRADGASPGLQPQVGVVFGAATSAAASWAVPSAVFSRGGGGMAAGLPL